MLAESNPHLYLQYLLLGLDTNIETHVVVPTQFSLLYSEERTLLLCRIWQRHSPPLSSSKLEVLEKQEHCLTCCAICCVPLDYHSKLPYQMALRIVAGPDANASHADAPPTWSYDVLLGMLCRQCQTTGWHALLPITLTSYPAICLVLAKMAFDEPLDADDDVHAQYLERIDWLNDRAAAVVAIVHGQWRCAHCAQHRKRKQMTLCPWGCEGVVFCRSGPCLEAAAHYHPHGLCQALKEGCLFHVTDAVLVDISGRTHGFSSGEEDDGIC